MAHSIISLIANSVSLIADQSNNHAVKVEEEHQEAEAKLDERFLLVHIQLAEDLSRIQEVLVVVNLLSVEGQERQVQDDSEPVAVNDEEECKESVNGSLGDNVGVKTVAKVDRVDVVTLKITVHDREEDLEEQVDGVDQHRQQVEPRFTRHCGQKVEEEEEQLEAMTRERRSAPA